jgi:DNA helicase-2/ATP-dependent DNA helicase PcrA
MIQGLVGPGGNLTAVGDEDQGIYRWRGAELRNILEFEKTFPTAAVRKLERNYRSTQTILDASGAVILHNEGRRGKELWTDVGAGELIELYHAADEGDEAQWVVNVLRSLHGQMRYGEMAILVRTNAQTRALEEELLRHGIPYCLVAGVRFYDRAEVKDLLAYLRLIQHPHDNLAFARVLNRPPRGIGQATREALEEEAAELGRSLWDVVRLDRLGRVPNRGAKALRAFRVLVEYLQGAARERPLEPFLELLLERTGYLELYLGDDPESAARRENLGELLSAAIDFSDARGLSDAPALAEEGESPLVAFLDQVALVSDVDGLDSEKGVSLMTLHSAKGLEFPAVFITGIEDGLLPHFNAGETQDEVEEERRLLYVGMTRAARRLFLTTCGRRRIAGRYQDRRPSPFLAEIPEEHLVRHGSPTLFADARTRDVATFFDRDLDEGPLPFDDGDRALGVGSRVRHATLGEGTVLDFEGEGAGAKVTVFFERVGKRRLVAKYAALEVL